jgi:SAM-dependent methyltransferase
MNGLINWEALQRHGHMGPPMGFGKDEETRKKFQKNFAYRYNEMARLEKKYTLNQVQQMILSPGDTVADIGCGPGRLSVPVAKKVKHVTSVDISEFGLAKCMENARNEGVSNITPLQLDWREAGAEEKVGIHDIVIASRSVGTHDLLKISRIARKYVFLIGFANSINLGGVLHEFLDDIPQNGRHQRELKMMRDRRLQGPDERMFDYNITFNKVYDLGVNPSIVVVDDGFERDYRTREEAYADLHFAGEISPEYEEQFRKNVDRYLLPNQDGGVKFLRKIRSFVMWWRPEELNQ